MSCYTEAVAELVAVGAAIASNCEPCLRFHYKRAQELGVADDDIAAAIATAQAVKETPARHVLALGKRLTGQCCASETESTADIESCCAAATARKSCSG